MPPEGLGGGGGSSQSGCKDGYQPREEGVGKTCSLLAWFALGGALWVGWTYAAQLLQIAAEAEQLT